MANIKACFSSKTDDWATPQDFFDKLDKEFNFDLDPCADEHNHKCEMYFTKEQNGLKHEWGGGIPYFAIPHTEKKYRSGFDMPTSKADSLTQRLSCSFPQGQTPGISMSTFTERLKSAS